MLKEVSRLIKLPHFRPKINKRALIKLCEICLSQMYFRVEDRYFEQKDALFIRALLSPPFGEKYFQNLFKKRVILQIRLFIQAVIYIQIRLERSM